MTNKLTIEEINEKIKGLEAWLDELEQFSVSLIKVSKSEEVIINAKGNINRIKYLKELLEEYKSLKCK